VASARSAKAGATEKRALAPIARVIRDFFIKTSWVGLQLLNAIVVTEVDAKHAMELLQQETDMYFLGIGLVLLLLKYLEIEPVAAWSWLLVLSPFGLAVAWWAWADSSGYTKRKAMERENARKQERIDNNRKAIGTLASKKRR
jgi:small Trp-rich protein